MKYDTALALLEDHGERRAADLLRDLRLREKKEKRPRRKTVSKKITGNLRDAVKAYYETSDEPQHVIGTRFAIQQGRVNDILQGRYDHLKEEEEAE